MLWPASIFPSRDSSAGGEPILSTISALSRSSDPQPPPPLWLTPISILFPPAAISLLSLLPFLIGINPAIHSLIDPAARIRSKYPILYIW